MNIGNSYDLPTCILCRMRNVLVVLLHMRKHPGTFMGLGSGQYGFHKHMNIPSFLIIFTHTWLIYYVNRFCMMVLFRRIIFNNENIYWHLLMFLAIIISDDMMVLLLGACFNRLSCICVSHSYGAFSIVVVVGLVPFLIYIKVWVDISCSKLKEFLLFQYLVLSSVLSVNCYWIQ